MTARERTVPVPDARLFGVIERRHRPFIRDGYEFCARDVDELWPCDAARLLSAVGDAYLAGALVEYREKARA